MERIGCLDVSEPLDPAIPEANHTSGLTCLYEPMHVSFAQIILSWVFVLERVLINQF